MAKKLMRNKIHLKCEVCNNQNYTTTKHRDMKEKLTLNKYCKHCRKETKHVEVKRLK